MKLKNNIKHHWNQKTALRFNEETWKRDWKKNRSEVILNWKKSLFLNKQYLNKNKKQEIQQQEYRII